MDDQAVDKQINNMVSFILQEAREKASEIQTLANEEFTIQRAKLVQTEKLKVQRDFERREKAILLQKKMYALITTTPPALDLFFVNYNTILVDQAT